MFNKQYIIITYFSVFLSIAIYAQCPLIGVPNSYTSLPNPCISNQTSTQLYSLYQPLSFSTTYDFGDGSPTVTNSYINFFGNMTEATTHNYTGSGPYLITLTSTGPGTCTSMFVINAVVPGICSTCSTYSNLSTGFDRANNVPFSIPTSSSIPGSFDPYWYVVKRQDVSGGPGYTPIPGTVVNYSGVLAYDIHPYGFSLNSLADSRYMSVNPTAAAVYTTPNIVTFRTYFNLPPSLPINKSYSLALSLLADDAIYQVSLNGVEIMPAGYASTGSCYYGPPLVVSASSCGSNIFQPGVNFLEVVVGDLGLVATQLAAEILLYECNVACPAPPTPCYDCISSFAPVPGKKYLISGWTKENNPPQSKTNYTYPSISVLFPSVSGSAGPFAASGSIIDGWQRIEGEFTIPSGATDMTVKLDCSTNDCFYDDVRVLPFDGSMKSYVYDPVNMRLVAELDERNYATLYEYDEEGKLIRVKKETEKGKMTIQENRNNTKK